MINSISSQSPIVPLQTTARPSKTSGAPASISQSQTVDSPVNENHEPPSEEVKEAPSQKAAEAMRALASQETVQRQSPPAQNIVSSQVAIQAYQQSK